MSFRVAGAHRQLTTTDHVHLARSRSLISLQNHLPRTSRRAPAITIPPRVLCSGILTSLRTSVYHKAANAPRLIHISPPNRNQNEIDMASKNEAAQPVVTMEKVCSRLSLEALPTLPFTFIIPPSPRPALPLSLATRGSRCSPSLAHSLTPDRQARLPRQPREARAVVMVGERHVRDRPRPASRRRVDLCRLFRAGPLDGGGPGEAPEVVRHLPLRLHERFAPPWPCIHHLQD